MADERINRGWSQQDLASALSRAGYSITQSGIDRMEKRDVARPKCTRELCAIFGVTELWLIHGKEPKRIQKDTAVDHLVKSLMLLHPDDRAVIIEGAQAQADRLLKRSAGSEKTTPYN